MTKTKTLADHTAEGRKVMGKYFLMTSTNDVMGEGTSSICRRGRDLQTGAAVAIKLYKTKKTRLGKHSAHNSAQEESIILTKFRRQIAVLKELQKPLEKPSEPSLWNEQLAHATPSKLFMQLIDYSKDKSGQPGPDPEDGNIYVVTEMAQYSLKDWIKLRRDEKKPPSRETVRRISKAIMLVTAGLHAKGLVHLDLKPENLMMFGGCLKLIDVDGCVKIGTSVSIEDSSLSFSPCYCAPEWAQFLIEDSDVPQITVAPGLDVWSIGMTLCDLVLLDAALKPQYASFMRHGRSHREASFHFMDWLASLKKAPLSHRIEEFDPMLAQMLTSCLLVCDPVQRRSLAQSLGHAYFSRTQARRSITCPVEEDVGIDEHELNGHIFQDHTSHHLTTGSHGLPAEAPRHHRQRVEDHSDAWMLQGTLWKLKTDGDRKDPSHWLRRDMWIATNGSLCYFSLHEDKRLVLLNAHHMHSARISKVTDGALEHAFMIETKPEHDDHDDHEHDEFVFACESDYDYSEWVRALDKAQHEVLRTMALGGNMAQELRNFRLRVRNRRQNIASDDTRDQFEPVFKAQLWKLGAHGDRLKEADWFKREMWLSKNGSLVYWSKKEQKELVYYSHSDVVHAAISISEGRTPLPWAFQVRLPPSDGLEHSPGEFAAESDEMRKRWISEFEKFAGSAH